MRTFALAIVLVISLGETAGAATKSSLERDGWQAVASGTIDGAFKGCDYNKPVPLRGGGIFVCQEYNYHYAYAPEIYKMVRNGSVKFVIDDEEFDGHVESGSVRRTHVQGDFDGCEFDKVIRFDNGLAFQCHIYHYHYAFHPEVEIFNVAGSYVVTIDSERYTGTLGR